MSAYSDQEAYLRAALHAAADSLEPRGDGLERIRTRIRQPKPAFLAWALAASADVIMRAPAWLQDAIYQVAGWFRLAAERFAPAQAPGKHRSGTQGLLRPLAAMAVVIFIVAVGTYVAIDASTAIFPSGSSTQPGGAPKGGHSGAPGIGAQHTSGTRSALGDGRSNPAPSSSCKPASPKAGQPTSAPAPQQSSSANASTSASPTPGDTSTSTDTSSPSPADTTSTSPAPPPSPAATAPPPDTVSPSAGLVSKSPSC
jgi:hypothetical protein